MTRFIIGVLAILAGASTVLAQNTKVIDERKAIYESFGKAVKQPGAAFRGDEAFDLAKVQAALKLIEEKSLLLPALFPDDSKTGGKTEALPKIWENKADFDSRLKKLHDAAKAAQASITDEASFKAQWKDLVGNCGGCHKEYRKPKD